MGEYPRSGKRGNDQGAGILNTLTRDNPQNNYHKYLKRFLYLFKPERKDILKLLLTTNLSRHKDPRRGNGLQSFKAFIDEVDNGELTIATEKYIYHAKKNQSIELLKSLQGTLIVWRICLNSSRNTVITLKEGIQNGN